MMDENGLMMVCNGTIMGLNMVNDGIKTFVYQLYTRF